MRINLRVPFGVGNSRLNSKHLTIFGFYKILQTVLLWVLFVDQNVDDIIITLNLQLTIINKTNELFCLNEIKELVTVPKIKNIS
ncbi:hypothetical protein BpHYR1_036578 [Brachionus plicatilis]|uniref:Uncharacterized protein n=1 Tax=Brachionus plicatilis TaxID=10195 RepID=A0A3M7QRC7_BRAPC|nr:hypothetical protein BpHYR1_036578 [Brachionus plicatilis]